MSAVNENKDTNSEPKPRKVPQRTKDSRVSQAAGYRMALLELWPLIADESVREEIRRRGHWADSLVAENGGILFRTFDQTLAEVEKQIAERAS